MNDQELIECIAQNAVREAYEIAEEYTYSLPADAADDALRALRRTLTMVRHDLRERGIPENKTLEASIKEIRKLSDTIYETNKQLEESKHATLQELRRKFKEGMA